MSYPHDVTRGGTLQVFPSHKTQANWENLVLEPDNETPNGSPAVAAAAECQVDFGLK